MPTLQSPRSPWPLIILATVLLVALAGYKIHSSLLPRAADWIADSIPDSVRQAIGERSLQTLDDTHFSASEIPLQRQQAIQASFNALLQEMEFGAEDYQLQFRRLGQPNAFALAGGTIVITDTLIEQLQPQQLDAILLHEIGHTHHDHLLKHNIRTSIYYLSMALLFGDINVVDDVLVEASVTGLSLNYSRQFERQADDFAARALIRHRGTASSLISALKRLSQSEPSNPVSWLSTHPEVAERIERLAER
ncbi:Ste24 endopeptidase [Saliniradius amylolyticus]|uniref:Ste24 endopeptidase n=1 Tax=Saliniradius amylolyticus TaxID=2183582 RepID=A0A2S2E0I0_9ALTE|nr:M48 family metallopeptidase [Saliniradius amylolyticus]AWL11144.1 Ste24 endopeptidase [Saliniradius amylolyticus]